MIEQVTPVIRIARESEARDVADVQIEGWRTAYRGILPDDLLDGMDLEERAEAWRRQIASKRRDQVVLVARASGDTVGFAGVGPVRDDDLDPGLAGEIYAMYVRPALWGAGVAQPLLRAAETYLRAHGMRQATLWVFAANGRARRFYERAGWREDGARRSQTERFGVDAREARYRRSL